MNPETGADTDEPVNNAAAVATPNRAAIVGIAIAQIAPVDNPLLLFLEITVPLLFSFRVEEEEIVWLPEFWEEDPEYIVDSWATLIFVDVDLIFVGIELIFVDIELIFVDVEKKEARFVDVEEKVKVSRSSCKRL